MRWAVRAGGGLAAFPKVRHGLALGASVWAASYVLLPLAKLYRPIWEYDARALARDLGDHLVSGLGAAGADRLLGARGRARCVCGRLRRRSPMRIEPVERDQAAPVVRRIYDAIEQQTGRVSPFFKMLGNKPDLLRAFNQLYGVVWAEGALQAKLKELAYLRVSILNGCGY